MNKAVEKRTFRRSHSDIRREDDRIIMRLEIPGVRKEDLSINVEGDKLIIEGKKMKPDNKGTWLVREILQDDYHMEFSIDETIDRSSIEASLNQGVLDLSLGLSEAVKPRKSTISSR
jgi:HSP20 family protein